MSGAKGAGTWPAVVAGHSGKWELGGSEVNNKDWSPTATYERKTEEHTRVVLEMRKKVKGTHEEEAREKQLAQTRHSKPTSNKRSTRAGGGWRCDGTVPQVNSATPGREHRGKRSRAKRTMGSSRNRERGSAEVGGSADGEVGVGMPCERAVAEPQNCALGKSRMPRHEARKGELWRPRWS